MQGWLDSLRKQPTSRDATTDWPANCFIQSEAIPRFGKWHVNSMELLRSFLRGHFAGNKNQRWSRETSTVFSGCWLNSYEEMFYCPMRVLSIRGRERVRVEIWFEVFHSLRTHSSILNCSVFSPEKLALLSLLVEVNPSSVCKTIKILIFDNMLERFSYNLEKWFR